MLFGNILLNVMGAEDFSEETFVGGKLIITKPDGSIVQFNVNEILHKNLVALDPETGIEI